MAHYPQFIITYVGVLAVQMFTSTAILPYNIDSTHVLHMYCTCMSEQTFQPFPFSVVMNMIYDWLFKKKNKKKTKQCGWPTSDSKNSTCIRTYMNVTCTHAHLDHTVYQRSVVSFPGRPVLIFSMLYGKSGMAWERST